jgi:hypothetical protein
VKTIVAGRIVASEHEFVEAALGALEFVPTAADFRDFAEFVKDTTAGPANAIDIENVAWLRNQLADIVPLPRRGATRLATRKEVRAA